VVGGDADGAEDPPGPSPPSGSGLGVPTVVAGDELSPPGATASLVEVDGPDCVTTGRDGATT
jgi:hypothetical protein